MNRSYLLSLFIAVLLFTGISTADVVTIVDTTPGTATNDGMIGMGEYVGSSTGINSGFGNVIGSSSSLHVDSDNMGNLNFGLETGGGTLNDFMVIYLDTRAGGFGSTTPLTDFADGGRSAVSGYGTNGTPGGQLTFAPGFEADFAISVEGGFAGLFELVGGGSHIFSGSLNLTNTGGTVLEMDTTLAAIGVAQGGLFNYVATYGNPFDGAGFFRSDEFHGVEPGTVAPGNPGQSDVALAAGDFNTFVTVPEPTGSGLLLLGLCLIVRNRRG